MDVQPPIPSLFERITASVPDEKARVILRAGYDSFLRFGLRRSSMQDIADRAGMSRAALYLHFRNKDDIFRALMEACFTAASEAVADTLAQHDDPVEALTAAFAVQVGDAAEAMMRSPHAEELLSHKRGAAADIVAAGMRRLADVYGVWLASSVMAGRIAPEAIDGNPHRTATTILSALDGLKHEGLAWADYLDARDRLALLFGRALRRS
ncbi:TetR/AcrR family transcriptional regulator [Roseibacterium beibuensis]|uniref:HTH tetR-type domain-containing protein n=1 Tax=[Roseibacterium] beibuensis TaxID=1193142 RepID=A0ABP9KXD1_9RHOB|nr:TetR/AcrR family transcriptional regulator [Roseibacterium beibuensis]MCS6622167.1 TetR/AcrR family transcriptional regulator [Roseibacterium beibuensis]